MKRSQLSQGQTIVARPREQSIDEKQYKSWHDEYKYNRRSVIITIICFFVLLGAIAALTNNTRYYNARSAYESRAYGSETDRTSSSRKNTEKWDGNQAPIIIDQASVDQKCLDIVGESAERTIYSISHTPCRASDCIPVDCIPEPSITIDCTPVACDTSDCNAIDCTPVACGVLPCNATACNAVESIPIQCTAPDCITAACTMNATLLSDLIGVLYNTTKYGKCPDVSLDLGNGISYVVPVDFFPLCPGFHTQYYSDAYDVKYQIRCNTAVLSGSLKWVHVRTAYDCIRACSAYNQYHDSLCGAATFFMENKTCMLSDIHAHENTLSMQVNLPVWIEKFSNRSNYIFTALASEFLETTSSSAGPPDADMTAYFICNVPNTTAQAFDGQQFYNQTGIDFVGDVLINTRVASLSDCVNTNLKFAHDNNIMPGAFSYNTDSQYCAVYTFDSTPMCVNVTDSLGFLGV